MGEDCDDDNVTVQKLNSCAKCKPEPTSTDWDLDDLENSAKTVINSTVMSFGTRLLEVRKSRGFSQAELAELLNTKPPVIGRYERGEATPSIEVGLKLAKILGVSLDYLTGYTELELDQNALKRIEDISKIPEKDRSFILKALDALLRDYKTQKAYSA